jgi:hypothetical protein
MDDLSTRLDRIAFRVEDRPDAFARLERRRRARSRGRRLTAGFLGMVIAVLGTVTAYSVLSTPRLQLPGGPGGQIAALWPEHDADQVRATQEAVDAGDTTMEWRLDAEETGVRFVRSVLGWPSPDERLVHNAVQAPNGMVTVDVTTVPNSCIEESCVGERDVIVQLLQFGDEDGIWSVISAESSTFNMQFRIGESVRVGDQLEVISGHPSGSEVAVGVNVFEPCSGSLRGMAMVRDHRVTVPVRGVEEGCLGYVYALAPGTDVRDDRGANLFDGPSGSGPTIDDIAVAPVFFVGSGSGSVSEVPQPEEV